MEIAWTSLHLRLILVMRQTLKLILLRVSHIIRIWMKRLRNLLIPKTALKALCLKSYLVLSLIILATLRRVKWRILPII